MCDVAEEEFAEQLLWIEAAATARARSQLRRERARAVTEIVASPLPEEARA